jgi:glycine/D-amino acid oxidase-like deaminating enzyme
MITLEADVMALERKDAAVIIVGGGVIGSSVAYHLAAAGERSVIDIERDPSYAQASSALSASSIRQQFTTPACIRMSQYGFHFLRHIAEYLDIGEGTVDVSLTERGYLYLADETHAPALETALEVQRANHASVRRLDRAGLRREFPWLRADDLVLGALGTAGEGWFDGYGLLQAFRRKARQLGVTYVSDVAVDLIRAGDRVSGVRTAHSGDFSAPVVVNAAGPRAASVAAWGGFTLPVAPERRCIFVFSCPEPPREMPMVIDPRGVYVRPEGPNFITGGPATASDDPDPFALNVDHDQFEEFIWPVLADRVPVFERIKMLRAWAGHYEMNLFDHNALIGRVPGLEGFMLATGFSGHGMQHSPAAGRGVAELIISGAFTTLDLSDFSPDRLLRNQRNVEHNIT